MLFTFLSALRCRKESPNLTKTLRGLIITQTFTFRQTFYSSASSASSPYVVESRLHLRRYIYMYAYYI